MGEFDGCYPALETANQMAKRMMLWAMSDDGIRRAQTPDFEVLPVNAYHDPDEEWIVIDPNPPKSNYKLAPWLSDGEITMD